MKKILLLILLAFGCNVEGLRPQKIEHNKETFNQLSEIDQLMSNISILTLMNINISEEPFDDIYLIAFTNYLAYNVMDINKTLSISPIKVSNYIISKMKQRVPFDDLSLHLIEEYKAGNFLDTSFESLASE